MPVETSVENQFCKACGAGARPGALFCYSCGSSVASGSTVESNGKIAPEKIETDGRAAEKAIAKPDSVETVGSPIEKPSPQSLDDKTQGAKVKNKRLVVEEETVLKTAAAVRRQQAKTPPKRVEIVWEEPQNSTGIWFAAVAFILILFAVGALLAMLYLH